MTFFFQEMPKLIRPRASIPAMSLLYRISAGPKVLRHERCHKDQLMASEFKGKKVDITRFRGGETPRPTASARDHDGQDNAHPAQGPRA